MGFDCGCAQTELSIATAMLMVPVTDVDFVFLLLQFGNLIH